MPSPDDLETTTDPEILAARGKVELAKAELESRLYQAGDTSKRALANMARKATPVAIAAAALVGVVVIARAVRARSKRRYGAPIVIRSEQGPSFARIALGAAVRAALRVLATRMAEQAVARLVEANEEHAPEASVSTNGMSVEPSRG